MKLNVQAFAIACSLVWGFGLFTLTWWIIMFSGVSGDQTFIGRVYLGYSISPSGSVIGLVWGLVDGLLGGFVFAIVYNRLVSRLGDNGSDAPSQSNHKSN